MRNDLEQVAQRLGELLPGVAWRVSSRRRYVHSPLGVAEVWPANDNELAVYFAEELIGIEATTDACARKIAEAATGYGIARTFAGEVTA